MGCGESDSMPPTPSIFETPRPSEDPAPGEPPSDPPQSPPPSAPAPSIEPEVLSDGTQRFDLPRYQTGSRDAPDGAVLNADGFYEVTVSPRYDEVDDGAEIATFELCTAYAIENTRIVITVGDCDPAPLDFFVVNEDETITFPFGDFAEGEGFFYSEARIRWASDE